MKNNPSLLANVIAVLFMFLVIVGIYAFVVWIFKEAWNLVMPYLFHLPRISFVQSIAVVFLISIFTGYSRIGFSKK